MLNTTTKRLFILICWLYNLNQCLINATQLDLPPDPNQYSNIQLSNGQIPQIANTNPQQLPLPADLRVFPFVIDPLIIIALIALPTIGLLGLSSLIMPLIPIGLYLINLFFPVGGSGKRKKREIDFFSDSLNESNYYNKELDLFVVHLSKAFDKYTEL